MTAKKKQKSVVGLIEKVTIVGEGKSVETLALFDTGARVTSVDTRLAIKAKLGPIVRTQRVKNPSFKQETTRPVVSAKVKLKGRIFKTEVNIQDRSHMTFPMIIGRNIISGNFVVDAEKNKHLFEEMKDLKEKNGLKGQAKLNEFNDH